jgi:rare lipoprotein A
MFTQSGQNHVLERFVLIASKWLGGAGGVVMRKSYFVSACIVAVGLALSGCSSKKPTSSAKTTSGFIASKKLDPFAGTGSPYFKGNGKIPMGGGRYHVGSPYQVAGRWFTPKEQPGYDKSGPASWYGEAFNRRKTSNGEFFDMDQLTAAHPTLPLPSYAKVTNTQNGREVIVRINDRGPFVGPRIIDLSKRVAKDLAFLQQGKTTVRVQYIGVAPINDPNARHLNAMNRELHNGTPLRRMIAAAGNGKGEQVYAEAKPKRRAEVQNASYEPTEASGNAIYFIQVGSFSDQNNAENVRQQLSEVGPVDVAELEGSNGTIYRVRLGPISDQQEAQSALEQVVASGHGDARLISAQVMETAVTAN